MVSTRNQLEQMKKNATSHQQKDFHQSETEDPDDDPADDADVNDDDEELKAEIPAEEGEVNVQRVIDDENEEENEEVEKKRVNEKEANADDARAKKKQKTSHNSRNKENNNKNGDREKSTSSHRNEIHDTIGGLLLEYAKSGRATCRKCSKAIDKDIPRVGMEAWISGRQAMTWQHVLCFLQNLSVSNEFTGRAKCSITSESIPKGHVKIAAHSHTATRYYTLDAVENVLSAVLSWVPSESMEKAKTVLNLEGIEGAKELSKNDQENFQSIITSIVEHSSLGETRGSIANQEDQAKPDDMKTQVAPSSARSANNDGNVLDNNGKPREGVISHQEGTVQWFFAGSTFEGTLLPNKETKSQCFAKTRNGHIKTLNKGKDYWSVVSNTV